MSGLVSDRVIVHDSHEIGWVARLRGGDFRFWNAWGLSGIAGSYEDACAELIQHWARGKV